MLKIWGRTNSINVQKVMWTVAEIGVACQRVDLGGAFGGLDADEIGKMNPNRKIPIVREGEIVVWESNACVRYLAARHAAGTLWPEDPTARAQADMWMDWQLSTLQPDMTVIFWTLIRTPQDKRDMAAVAVSAERIGNAWRILDAALAGRAYLIGDSLSMGDIPLGCHYWRYRALEVAKPALPHLDAWYDRLQQRPAYREHVMLPVT